MPNLHQNHTETGGDLLARVRRGEAPPDSPGLLAVLEDAGLVRLDPDGRPTATAAGLLLLAVGHRPEGPAPSPLSPLAAG